MRISFEVQGTGASIDLLLLSRDGLLLSGVCCLPNILDKLDKGPNIDPNNNYELFAQLIKYATEKHIPRVRYQKKKHKRSKWLTNGILNSINTKDRLYKILMQNRY